MTSQHGIRKTTVLLPTPKKSNLQFLSIIQDQARILVGNNNHNNKQETVLKSKQGIPNAIYFLCFETKKHEKSQNNDVEHITKTQLHIKKYETLEMFQCEKENYIIDCHFALSVGRVDLMNLDGSFDYYLDASQLQN